MRVGEEISSTHDLRQGDVIDIEWVPAVIDGAPGAFQTPCGVVVLSQTCDVVQSGPSKANVTVAPILCSPEAGQLSDARRGRAPLLVHLPGLGETEEALADVQRAASLPKDKLLGRTLLGRHIDGESTLQARNLAERVGRVYSRFAFPDQVVPVLRKMKNKARQSVGGSGAFGRVLDHLEFRIQASHWDSPGRVLRLFVIVDSSVLIMPDDADPDWDADTSAIPGLGRQERIESASLTRLSELLADGCDKFLNDPMAVDGTTLLRLWEAWVLRMKNDLLDPQTNEEVIEFRVELIGDEEMTLSRWRRTVSLDLEDLSDSTLAVDAA